MTVWRRQEFGILPDLASLTDEELQRLVREMRAELPEMGESIVWMVAINAVQGATARSTTGHSSH